MLLRNEKNLQMQRLDVEGEKDEVHRDDNNDKALLSSLSNSVVVFGMDIGHFSKQLQFVFCALGVFSFSLFYGYLQELISVQICNRRLGLFLATVQFAGYSILSYLAQKYSEYIKIQKKQQQQQPQQQQQQPLEVEVASAKHPKRITEQLEAKCAVVPLQYYVGISLLRALDLAMTNCAMRYINYPAKTLMKSSRMVFTMIFGVLIGNKRYRIMDYLIVLFMMCGLALFLHADATNTSVASATAVVLHPMGVIMLTMSLLCDGAVSNYSEYIMNHYNIDQDEYIFRIYSLSLIVIFFAAAYQGDLLLGFAWMMQPGTYNQLMEKGAIDSDMSSDVLNKTVPFSKSWSVMSKLIILILFNCTGFISSSFLAAITKYFGALAMSVTSTIRKATTVFLSFFLFDNVCTLQHGAGVTIFMAALLSSKSVRQKQRQKQGRGKSTRPSLPSH